MILEVRQWPESQEVMEDPEWFFVCDAGEQISILGDSAYARVIKKYRYINEEIGIVINE